LENFLTEERSERDGSRRRTLAPHAGRPRTFNDLLGWVKELADGSEATPFRNHHQGKLRKLYRRLLKLVLEGDSVLRRSDQRGNPLEVTSRDTRDPVVIDLSSLAAIPSLQRFVVATICRQLVDERTGSNVQRGLIYLVTLDELNRFAPRGAHDPITQLIEQVAAEMRSQGIILLGAQQQASLGSPRVIENAGPRDLGKSGCAGLGRDVWGLRSDER